MRETNGMQRFLAPDGTLVRELPAFARPAKTLVALYRAMVLTRSFDEKAVALQRTGRLGTFASSLGQEAVGVGVAAAMTDADILAPSFRDQGAQLWRGVTMTELLLYWGGDERGSDFAGPKRDFPVNIPVASQYPQAAGAALALTLRGETAAVVAIGGDGSTSKGDFYESLNVAAVWKLPLVMVIANNQWAISMPRAEQTAAETLAQKALAAGARGERVDGNDVIAVRACLEAALGRARAGEGPTLVEAVTYRLADHTTADDASRYRDERDVAPHWKEEPLARLRAYLAREAGWSKEDEQELVRAVREEVDKAAEVYLATPPEAPEAMFDNLYASLPKPMEAELAAFRRSLGDG